MPSLSEMLVQQTGDEIAKQPDIAGAAARGTQLGISLAQHVEDVQNKRQQLEIQKQQLQMQKATAITDTMKTASQAKDPRMRNYLLKNVVPSKVKALGMDEFFTPQSLDMISQSPEALDKVLGLQMDLENKIQKGEMTSPQAFAYAKTVLSDPEQLANLNTDRLLEAQKFATTESGKTNRAETTARIQAGKEDPMNVAQKKNATEVAGKYADWMAGGGKAAVEDSIGKLQDAAKALRTGEITTGGVTTKLPWLKSDDAQTMLNPEMANMKVQAQSALNAVLRQTLGSAFTEQEGLRVLNQIWDDRQAPAVNAKKIENKVSQLVSDVKNKEGEFRRYRLLQPGEESKFQSGGSGGGKEWQNKIGATKDLYGKLPPAEQEKYIELNAKKYGIKPAQVKKALGVN